MNEKICPLLRSACQGDRCALWDIVDEQCAILSIAFGISTVEETLGCTGDKP